MKIETEKMNIFRFLTGGGEMGELIRAKDWSSNPVGNPDSWPQSLRTTLSILLNSKFPMFLWWGPDLICFYNDSYRPSLGINGKHPIILGQRAEEAWSEIWDIIKPLIDQVLSGGEATWSEDQLIPIYRNGKIEDVYWTFSYSPVNDESGKPAGVFVTCTETTGKVLTLKKLEESKDQLAFAIEATELGTFDYNPLTNRFSSNKRLKDWFGLPSDTEIELHHAINAIAEKDRQIVTEAIQHALIFSSGGRYDIAYRIVHPVSKKETVVRAKGRAWFNENKIAYRFNGTLQDVTEQNRVEKERQDLIAIIDASHEFIGLASANSSIQYCNPAALKMLGWDNVQGKNILDCVYPDDHGLAKLLLSELFEKGYFSREIRFVNSRNLEPFWLLWNGVAIREEESGQIIGLAIVSPNITERKKGEENLAKTTRHLQIALEAGKLGSYELDLLTGAIQCTAQCKQNFGLEESDHLNYSSLIERVLPADRTGREQAYQHAIQNNTVYNAEYRISTPEGKIHWIHAAGIPLFNEEGKAIQITGVTADITEQKLFEQELANQVEERTRELEQKNKELEKLNGELQSFAYVSGHDLQEPLRKVQTFASLILDNENQNLSDKGKDYFARMREAAKRMQTLIEDLLSYSRTTTSERKFELTDLNGIIADVKDDLKEIIAEKQARIETDEMCDAFIIPFQFSQLMHNLIGNSLKFSKPGIFPIIKIRGEKLMGNQLDIDSVSPDKMYCHISLSDNGIGFDPQYKDRIFEVFQRLHGRHEFSGTGIGLAIVKKIVENHNGIIVATGEKNKGAKFDIFIPAI